MTTAINLSKFQGYFLKKANIDPYKKTNAKKDV